MSNWIYLFIAAIFEIGWPLGFKLSNLRPEHFWVWISLGLISYMLSGFFLYLAQRTIPVSTAYIIWGGAGALCTFLIGICFFGDAITIFRMLFALLILTGIVGLEITAK